MDDQPRKIRRWITNHEATSLYSAVMLTLILLVLTLDTLKEVGLL